MRQRSELKCVKGTGAYTPEVKLNTGGSLSSRKAIYSYSSITSPDMAKIFLNTCMTKGRILGPQKKWKRTDECLFQRECRRIGGNHEFLASNLDSATDHRGRRRQRTPS